MIRLNFLTLCLLLTLTVVYCFSKIDFDDLAYNILDLCPPVACYGVNCTIVTESNGCKLCACPTGSMARGCDQIPEPLYQELVEGGCPNPKKPYQERPPPRMVYRWYRYKPNSEAVDECRSYIFPYCRYSDYNLWRSPRSKKECIHMCYTETERTFLKLA